MCILISKVARPSQFGLPDKEVILVTKDGYKIRSYVMIQRGEEVAIQSPTVVCFHAHTGNMGHRLPIAQVFYKKLGYNVVMLSYRGYGLSEGRPTEKGLKIDAQTMLEYIKQHPILKHTKLIAYGQSLGGSVAISLVSRNEDKFDALIIENTFLSVKTHTPTFMKAFASATYIPSIETFGLSGASDMEIIQDDQIFPPGHMAKLYNISQTSGVKVWRDFENGTHNDTCMQSGFFESIAEFVRDNVWELD
ncbi:hypothetical protein MBANPS3_010877 [Mucor bainieri]